MEDTHYNDKVTIGHILYSKLAELSACNGDGRNLHTLYNRMFALVRQITDGNDDTQETGLGAILLNKLPLRVRSQLYDRAANSRNLSPSELLRLLTDIVKKDTTLQEMIHYTRRTPTTITPTPHQRWRNEQQRPCNATFNGIWLHALFLSTSILCYHCFSNKHVTKKCTSKCLCIFCSNRHHLRFAPARVSFIAQSSPAPTQHGTTSIQKDTAGYPYS